MPASMFEHLPGAGHQCIALFPKLREEICIVAILQVRFSQLVRFLDFLSARQSKKFGEAIGAHKKANPRTQLFISYGRQGMDDRFSMTARNLFADLIWKTDGCQVAAEKFV